MNTFKKLINDESGATAIEYGLLAALIGVAVIAGGNALAPKISSLFTDIGECLEAAESSGSGTGVSCD